jgi:hypothetical protein
MSFWGDWLKPDHLKLLSKWVVDPWLLSFVFVTGLASLALPPRALRAMGLLVQVDAHRTALGAMTLLSFAGMVVLLARRGQVQWHARRAARYSLQRLSPSEKAILAYCLDHGQDTVTLQFGDPIASGLEAKGLLWASPTGKLLRWSFTVSQFAWHRLQRDPSVLQIRDPREGHAFDLQYQWVSELNNTAEPDNA